MSKSNINCFIKVFLFVMVVVSGITPIVAQDGSAILRSEVLDPSGAVVPGATVSIANQETGLNRRSVTTSDSGDYVFASLIPGLYRITVEAAGFKKSVKEDVRLNVGETQEFKFSTETRRNRDFSKHIARHFPDSRNGETGSHFPTRFPPRVLVLKPVYSI